MAKVKLTESELHQLIVETVKNVLTELDWRTYHNAALKSINKANDKNISNQERAYFQKRAENFEGYSDKKFQDKYGINKKAARRAHNEWDSSLDDLKAGADVSRNERGGDEYINGKWRKK
jgi:hypothetical protein